MTTGSDVVHHMQKRLSIITECPICTDTFSDPRTLPCIHTFCLKCIKGFCGNKLPGSLVACPVCRTAFTVPSKGTEGLPKNFFIEQLKDIAITPTSHCEGCSVAETETATASSGKPAAEFCIDCRQRFCQDCIQIHGRVRATREHKFAKIGDEEDAHSIVGKEKPIFCDTHPEEALKLYCFDCQTAICFMCFVELHKLHKCSDVNKVVDDFRTHMTCDIEKLNDLVARCRDMLNEQERSKATLSSAVTRIEKEICERVKRLKTDIDSEKRRLLKELETRHKDRLKQIQLVVDDIKQLVSFADSLIKYTDELKNKGSAGYIAQQTRALHDRADELMKLDKVHQGVSGLGSVNVNFDAARISVKGKESLVGQVNWCRDEGVQPSAISTPQTLTHVVIDDGRSVVGVTFLDSRLFVLRSPSQQQIQVFDSKNFKQEKTLHVKDLNDHTIESGLASCVTYNCIYVSDCLNDKSSVYKIELSGDNTVFGWRVDTGPRGLSVNAACNLLVACYWACKIQEYTTDGLLVRELCLKLDGVDMRPLHAVPLTSELLAVGCRNVTNKVFDVVEVDMTGQVTVSYANQLNSTTQQKFDCPRHLEFHKNTDCIFIADRNNSRILILDRSFSHCARELNASSVDNGIQRPSCLCFDLAKNRLFVGEWSGHRVLVFDRMF